MFQKHRMFETLNPSHRINPWEGFVIVGDFGFVETIHEFSLQTPDGAAHLKLEFLLQSFIQKSYKLFGTVSISDCGDN